MNTTEDNLVLFPRAVPVIQALEEYRVAINASIYRFYFYGREMEGLQNLLHSNDKMVNAGFPQTIISEDIGPTSTTITIGFKRFQQLIKGRQRTQMRISFLRNQSPSLGRYIDSNQRAIVLNFELRKLLDESEMEMFSGRLDITFINTFRALRLKTERDKTFPLWNLLNNEDKTFMSDGYNMMNNNMNDEAGDLNVNNRLLRHLLYIREEFTRKHVDYVCSHHKFHCRYLDDEIANMFQFMLGHSTSEDEKLEIYLWSNDEVKLDILQSLLDNPHELAIDNPPEFYHPFYKACLNNNKNALADEWMKLRFRDDFDSKKARMLFQKTRGILRKLKRRGDRIELNGRHEGISGSYRLPELKTAPARSSEKPWWVRHLRTPREMDQVDYGKKYSCDSQAETVLPPESSTTVRSTRVSRDQLRREASETNKAAANYYRTSNRLSDYDMCKIPMCPVTLNMSERLNIKWRDFSGKVQERITNFVAGGKYHGRCFSYDALNNEWLGKDECYHVIQPLNVTLEGAFRVPIVGQNGTYLNIGSLFKVQKDKADHNIDRYLADVRAQSIAAYYADRFRELTGDEFGCLRMLNLEMVLVFDSSKRQTIIEIMTCESHVEYEQETSLSYIKFTNNWTFKPENREIDIMEAYSHFSYVDSEGVLMITDLQGFYSACSPSYDIVYYLTDPAIHCQTRAPVLFGRANYGEEGMRAFFASIHTECNDVCRYLNLKRPDWE